MSEKHTPGTGEARDLYIRGLLSFWGSSESGMNRNKAGAEFDRLIAKVKADAASELAEILAYAYRFWPRVEVGRKQECWPWTGPTLKFGHGRADTPAGKAAHRYAWATANGRMPLPDEVVRHKCDNPPCCNPAHLEIGTQMDNVNDAIDRGRAPFERGKCKKGHLLTPENSLFRKSGERRCRQCANEYQNKWHREQVKRSCWQCGAVAHEHNLRRHFKNQHGADVTIDEIRNQAGRIEGEA